MKILKNIIIICSLAFALTACIEVRPAGGVLTKQEALLNGKRVATNRFTTEDVIRCYVSVTWDDVTAGAGEHSVIWNWYKGEKLISSHKKKLDFNYAPYEVYTTRPAFALGVGHFKVETLVDGKIMDSREFDIVEK